MSPPAKLQGKRGTGAFQWNFGGWFGSQVGATLWMILMGSLLLAQGRQVGVAIVLLGVFANAVGCVLWRMRDVLPPYPAIQVLIATAGSAALAAMLLLSASDRVEMQLPGDFWFLLIYPGLMLAFHLQDRAARRAGA